MKGTLIGRLSAFLTAAITAGGLVAAQDMPQTKAAEGTPQQGSQAYQPKFPGDPARSDSEAQALGYMRVVLRAQKLYKKKHDKYAPSLASLAGTGSLTKRMAATTDRGDYTVGFRAQKARSGDKDGFVLTMTPKAMDTQHRSFYAEEDGVIRGDETKPADENSPRVK